MPGKSETAKMKPLHSEQRHTHVFTSILRNY